MIFTLVLANDTPELHRKKEGDIVAVVPYPHHGGAKARKQYLYVPVEFDDIFDNWSDVRKFQVPLFDDGSLWYSGSDEEQPERIAKNRYSIAFSQIDTLAQLQATNIDWKLVRNEDIDYQPLLDGGIIFSWNTLIHNKASGLKLDRTALEIIRDYGK